MRKHNLTSDGLSMTQGQSVSNLAHQRAETIINQLNSVNNFGEKVKIDDEYLFTVAPMPMPENIVELIETIGELHGCEAFLMENIKAKEALLDTTKRAVCDTSSIVVPERPKYIDEKIGQLKNVNEEFGWEQLKPAELNEYHQAKAFASSIGTFIHKGSVLDKLRKQLPEIPAIKWMTIKEGEKTPIKIVKHHTSEELLSLHEKLATKHREFNQRVNYYEAKVKNLMTQENARIVEHNAAIQNSAIKINDDLRVGYEMACLKYTEEVQKMQSAFEKERQENIKKYAALRINVDPKFQKTIDMFLVKEEKIIE